MTGPNRTVSERGFTGYDEFSDAYGAQVTVHESSAASAPHVWVRVRGGGTECPPGFPGIPEGHVNDGAAHLNAEQARRLRDALDAFLAENGDRP